MGLLEAAFGEQLEAFAGSTLLGAGVLALLRPRSWPIALGLLAGGVTWFAPAEAGPFGTVFIHRAALAFVLAEAGTAGRRWVPTSVSLLAFGAVCVAPAWAATPWMNGVAWLVAAAAIGLSVRSSPRRTRLVAALLAFCVMGLVAVVGVAVDWPDREGRRIVYHLAIVSTVLLTVRALRAPIDPSVVVDTRGGRAWAVGVRGPLDDGFVAMDGTAIDVDTDTGRRRVEFDVGDLGTAVLVHDDPAFDDPRVQAGLARAVATLAQQAMLQRRIRAQAADVEASRRRVLRAESDASAEMMRAVERDVQPHLDAIAVLVETASAHGDARVTTLLDDVRGEVHSLVSGATPALLTNGIVSALRLMATTSTIPARVDAEELEIGPATEKALYMVASEAMANAAKHSSATEVVIGLRRDGNDVVVEVSDDGVGGARSTVDGGIGQSRRRVSSLGGSLELDSPPGCGTRLTARMPIA